MDRDEIKLQLAGYRPELYADDDPEIAEALALAKADPELSAWLEAEVAFDQEFASALCTAEPPATAQADLLAALAQSSKGRRVGSSKRRGIWLAAAAAFVLLAVGGVKYFLFPPAVEFADTGAVTVESFRDQMAHFANERFVLDKFYKEIGDSQQWLEAEEFPVFDEIPSKIVNYKGMGCKAIDWRGTKVGLVCFKSDEGDIVHLFVVDAAAFDDLSSPAVPLEQMAVVRGLETGGWRDGDKVLLVVGSAPDVPVGEFL